MRRENEKQFRQTASAGIAACRLDCARSRNRVFISAPSWAGQLARLKAFETARLISIATTMAPTPMIAPGQKPGRSENDFGVLGGAGAVEHSRLSVRLALAQDPDLRHIGDGSLPSATSEDRPRLQHGLSSVCSCRKRLEMAINEIQIGEQA